MLNWFLRLVALDALVLAGMANAAPITLTLSFFTSDRGTIYQCQIKPFVDAVNAEAPEQIKIEVTFARGPNAVLSEQQNLVLSGATDIADVPLMATPEKFPNSTALLLPGLFRSPLEANRVYSALVEAGALTGYDKFVVLGTFLTTGENIHSRKPIDTLAALRGQVIRVSNQIEADTLKKLGATPALLLINETMDSLGQGKIDGVTSPPPMLTEFGFGRLTSHHYMLQLGSVPSFLGMNRAKFTALPAGGQAIIRKYGGKWLSERAASCVDDKDREIATQLRADTRRHVVYPSPADQAIIDRVFANVTEQWAAESAGNRELLKLVKDEIAKVRGAK